ncbi:hypothetical protein BCF55_1684 [Hydrogenivirga caldilitoris]|uniref:Uncharacterized protein n=1 Tax=Hydrogenivirga caldilitoris TaxID=246264 RepID=A0A497XW46_9AQUI|nr:hypothetical protein [Hydrogenivirga caldilitoris]RLJ71382.1 hypothetical protein BCF55_1684 [Hydrogenivirga caldilitoris]
MKECRLEGVGRKGNLLLSWGLFLVPFLVFLYIFMPSIAMGYVFNRIVHFSGNGALPMNLLVFLLGFILFFKVYDSFLKHYYGEDSFSLINLFFRGAMSSFSTLELQEDRAIQRFDNRTVQVNLRKGELLWIMAIVPLIVLRDREGNVIPFLTLSFGRGGKRRFLECLSLATGIDEEQLNFRYFRDFLFRGMKYSKSIDLSRKFY